MTQLQITTNDSLALLSTTRNGLGSSPVVCSAHPTPLMLQSAPKPETPIMCTPEMLFPALCSPPELCMVRETHLGRGHSPRHVPSQSPCGITAQGGARH